MENNYNYNPYRNPNGDQGMHQTTSSAYEKETMAGQKRSAFEGFGVTLTKCVAIALVFGLVAGTAFTAVNYFTGNMLGLSIDSGVNGEDNKNPGNGNSLDNDSVQANGKPSVNLGETNTDGDISVSVLDVSDIVTNVMPCIVAINNTSEVIYQGMWGQSYTQEKTSCGTGFLVQQDDKYIYIATNNHVVADAKKLTVQFSDDAEVEAEIKGTVPSKDLAVIKVAIKDISAETLAVIRLATIGNSNELKVGEGAIAIGNALGYGQSVTMGLISALGRSVTVSDSSTGTTIVNSNLIQTDAAINPGNSGGALLNTRGEVIGINSVKYADTDVEGIGYAIPITDAMLIVNKLISGEKIDANNTGYLGIQGADGSNGVYVHKVFAGSAAEKAGICVGDIIVEFEGNTISTMSQLKELLSYYPAGEEVEFVIYHAQGNEYVKKEVKVTLGDASSINQ